MATNLAVTLVLVISVFAAAMANKNHQAGGNVNCPPCPCTSGWGPPAPGTNVTHEPKEVNVGESQNWHFGFDYASWATNYAIKSPFFVGDKLVFKYTTENNHNHSVVLLPNYESYNSCDVTKAKLIGKPGEGTNGVSYTLTAKKPNEDPYFYFACGEGSGYHCKVGKMKFIIYAWPQFK